MAKRALITGSRGTIGGALRAHLEAQGWEVVGWDRSKIPNDDYARMKAFVGDTAPTALFHLATASQPTQTQLSAEEVWSVNYEWTSELAWITRELDIPFVFTSTVMVFTEAVAGPYTIAMRPDAAHDYGRTKKEAEARVFAQNPCARVARLGWQIGEALTGNQMAAWLQARGGVEASTRWIPACSMLADTAAMLRQIAESRPGLYHVDGNEGWSFYDLAMALRQRHGADWTIVPTFGRAYDQRLLDPRLELPSLRSRLPQLVE
ncbi:MAG: sugar nucleotide-binding protein [Nannocystales bacterium]